MSRYRQTMREALEQVKQQFTEGHSDKDFKPYSDWKKTSGGMYPRFKHSQKGEIEIDRYGEWLHSDKSGKTIAFYRNHFPKTNTTGGTSMKLTDYLKKINEEVINEVSDHEVSMARGELEAIADKATQLAGALQGKSDEGNPLEAWVQSKITKAKDYINSVSDYLTYDPSMKQNEETEVNEVNIKKVDGKKGFDFKGQFITDPTMDPSGRFDVDPKKYYKLNDKQIKDLKEEVNEKTYGWTLVSKAKDLAKKFKDNITKAVAEIEKLEKGLSKNPTVDAELRKYNENLEEKYTVVITKKDGTTMELGKYNTSAEAQRYVDQYGKGAKVKKEEIEIEEGKMSDIDALVKDGKSSEEIAKLMKLPVKTVKDILGEEKEVPKGYHRMPDGTIMKDSEHKKETHSFMTKDMNKSKKDAKGEKEIVDPEPKMKQESIQDAIANVWKMSAEELEKIKTEAKYMKAQRMSQYRAEKDEKNKKGTADTGSKMTPVDVEPKVDYKN